MFPSGCVSSGLAGVLTLALLACSIEQEGLASPGGAGGTSGASPVSGGGKAATGSGGVDDAGVDVVVSCGVAEQCVPRPPAGWEYGFLAGMAYADPAPPGEPCFDTSTPGRFFMDPEPEAQCASCSCGPLTGAACHIPLLCADNASCAPFQDWSKNDGDCHGQVSNRKLWCQLGAASFPQSGSCVPSGGSLQNPTPWKQLADVCVAAPLGSCGDASDCVPRGGGKYDGFVCVTAVGERACPSDYPVQSFVYKAGADGRACSPCTCAASGLTCLPPEYTFYDDALCLSSVKSVNSPTCTDLNGATDSFVVGYGYKRKSGPTVKGQCTPGGGQPSGKVVGAPDSALTVCCRSAGP